MDKVVTIPTYDEKDNVRPISQAIFGVDPETDILFMDDNSPDGTGRVVDEMVAEDERINVIHNPSKAGLGRAYIAGFKWALERDYSLILGMDADFSHDPEEIPNLVRASADALAISPLARAVRANCSLSNPMPSSATSI